MKAFRTAAYRVAIVVAALALVGCEKPPAPTPWQTAPEIEMDLLVVRMPEKRALPLIGKLRNPQHGADATKETLNLVESGQAELVGWPFVSTRDGERAVVEQVDEFRYASEYEPPDERNRNRTAHSAMPRDPPVTPGSIPTTAATTTVDAVDAAMPSDFETRNIGVVLEAEPSLTADGHTIELSLVARHDWLKGMRKSSIEGVEPGHKVVVEQPEFVTNKVTTNLTMRDGDYALLGAFKVTDPPGQMELFILHTRLKRVPAPPGTRTAAAP